METASAAPAAAATPRSLAASLGRYFNVKSIPFWIIHALAIAGVVWLGWSWRGLGLAVAFYFARMFFVTAAYHRYFSHRTFRTSRPFQFLLAFFAQTSAQKGALWWAAHHRWHHRYSDDKLDVHSAKQEGFWWSHIGWILSKKWEHTNLKLIPDFARYPELLFLNRHPLLPAWIFGLACYLIGGPFALVWCLFVSTVLLWHGTFTINSLTHMIGKRRYATKDDSRNHWLLAIITMGEGWHNNHHHYMNSTNQGFFWWEIDVTYYLIRGLGAVGLVWDIRRPPPHVLTADKLVKPPLVSEPLALPLPLSDEKQPIVA